MKLLSLNNWKINEYISKCTSQVMNNISSNSAPPFLVLVISHPHSGTKFLTALILVAHFGEKSFFKVSEWKICGSSIESIEMPLCFKCKWIRPISLAQGGVALGLGKKYILQFETAADLSGSWHWQHKLQQHHEISTLQPHPAPECAFSRRNF